MCVIMVSMTDRPTPEMVQKAWDRNGNGGGVAYRITRDGKTLVRWQKDLNLEEMKEACKDLPMPFIAHFRYASSGGVRPELCHPFEVSLETGSELEGETENGMFFHNGDWTDWRTHMLKACLRMGTRFPGGKWSDSRAMAWLMSMFGPGFIDMLDQKGVLITPDDLEFFVGTGWKTINNVYCSNDLFWGGVRITGVCREHNCSERNGLDSDGRCNRHRKNHPLDPAILPDEEETEDKQVCRALIRMHDHDKSKAGSGGSQQTAPFPVEVLALLEIGAQRQALMTAEEMHLKNPKKLSKNLLKRIRKFINGNTLAPVFSGLESNAQEEKVYKDGLKDTRMEVVTVH